MKQGHGQRRSPEKQFQSINTFAHDIIITEHCLWENYQDEILEYQEMTIKQYVFYKCIGDDWPWLNKNLGTRHQFLPNRASLKSRKMLRPRIKCSGLIHLVHNIKFKVSIGIRFTVSQNAATRRCSASSEPPEELVLRNSIK